MRPQMLSEESYLLELGRVACDVQQGEHRGESDEGEKFAGGADGDAAIRLESVDEAFGRVCFVAFPIVVPGFGRLRHGGLTT
jgi:hypothetical protein